ncbi:HelD family protein [Acrocarpospora macrocephala]|uniref:HelD family protein n=1 Tax=Acrocarpospora macrocephala TaxID=150177 RepID=UPI001FE396EC|nr:ATP-binding domain-containing protein [Acrocarpospora macrocephala]
MNPRQDIQLEQDRVSLLYYRLDTVRERTEKALAAEQGRGEAGGTRQARVEREVAAGEHVRRLAQLNAVERGLCFGRIDLGRMDESGETLYIGRIGLRNDEHETVLVDWRAPAARPFYAATPSAPAGLVRRRHLRTRGRTVIGVDDEVFDLTGMSDGDRNALVGEAALLAALQRGRTGRMGDVVATIQTEQDRVIRSGLHGTLVVQGGPGTGKTVAALHRAAYLLYTYRDTLARRGVLVVGPNAIFSRYIEQVLPSLGETDVVLSSVGELFPGVAATHVDTPAVALIKGDLRMVEAMAGAVADRQRVPDGDLEIELDALTLVVPHAVCVQARKRAARHLHNVGRKLFALDLLRALARDEARQLDAPDDEEDLEYARKVLWQEPAVRAAIDALWPALTPYQLVADLFADRERLTAAGLSEALLRPAGAPWTVDDVPLLDEAAELLGQEPQSRAQRLAAQRARQEEELYAREVLTITGQEDIDAAAFADWHNDRGPDGTTASRAAADRGWIYGHVIVDEAQELSAMAWRMVMRRVPTRSMTVVGDLGQTGSPAGARSWSEMLDGYVEWREERLTVNYRTPKEIMDVAADVLRAVAPDQEPPRSVRHGEPPHAIQATPGTLPGVLADLVATPGDGRIAVITTDARYAEVAALLPEAVTLDPLDSPVALLTVTRSKGLEFDEVVVVAPEEMAGRELYVAITRATRRLTVVHEGELPAMLRGLLGESN